MNVFEVLGYKTPSTVQPMLRAGWSVIQPVLGNLFQYFNPNKWLHSFKFFVTSMSRRFVDITVHLDNGVGVVIQ